MFQNEHSKIRYFHGPFQCYQTICHVNSHLFYLTAKINFQIMQLILNLHTPHWTQQCSVRWNWREEKGKKKIPCDTSFSFLLLPIPIHQTKLSCFSTSHSHVHHPKTLTKLLYILLTITELVITVWWVNYNWTHISISILLYSLIYLLNERSGINLPCVWRFVVGGGIAYFSFFNP